MKLFLTSQGLAPEVTADFLELLGKEQSKCKLAFIPTAADPYESRPWVDRDKARLSDMGFKIEIIDLRTETRKSLPGKLKRFDVVFVEGGNTFYLLKYVRQSGFDVAVKDFLCRGGIYVGVSAGSYIAGLNIEPAGWKHADRNVVGLKDMTAMKLVPFVISAHLDESNRAVVENEAKKAGHPVVALTDKQALVVDGKKTTFVGEGKVLTFNMPETFK